MTENQLAQLIDSYLDGSLGEGEKEILMAKAIENPEIATEIQLRKDINTALSEEDVLLLENKLNEMGKKHKADLGKYRQEVKVVPMLKKYRALAAGLAILIIASLVFLFRVKEPVDLYANYYEPYPMYITTRSTDDSNENLNLAVQAYSKGSYQAAWSSFLTILSEDTSDMGVMFYTAMSALQIDRYPDAVAGLKKVAVHGDNIYAAPAEWYLALAFIKSGDHRNARKTLENIIEKKR